MRRTLLVAVAIASLFALGGVAQAQDPPAPNQDLPEEFAPPGPGPVTDAASAGAFTERYVARNARRLARESGRRLRVLDVEAACLQHPIRVTRFGCVFTLRALVFRNRGRGHYDGHDRYEPARSASRRSGDRPRRQRVRFIGCLGAVSVDGGVSPTARLRFVECSRVNRRDLEAPEVEPVA